MRRGVAQNAWSPQTGGYPVVPVGVARGVLAGLLMRSESAEDRVVTAFPDVATFSSLARRVSVPLAAAAIEVWMVSAEGTVIEGDPA
jgi:hypothetical protein